MDCFSAVKIDIAVASSIAVDGCKDLKLRPMLCWHSALLCRLELCFTLLRCLPSFHAQQSPWTGQQINLHASEPVTLQVLVQHKHQWGLDVEVQHS